MNMSQAGLDKLTKPWEEYVGHPYDDKAGKVRINGHWQYPEWRGGPARGTVTIGYGHTDAAGAPMIVPGMRLTEAQADELLLHDMAPCVAMVNRALKVKVSQHTFDAIADLTFNCPSALRNVAAYINAGNKSGAAHIMLQYINSKGERMEGLVHRRTAEIAWMNTPDSPDEAAATVISPKAERTPPPKTMAASKTGAAAVATASGAAGSVIAGIQAANEAAAPVKEARDNLTDLGLMEHLVRFAHSPKALIIGGCIVIALCAFIWLDRRYKLLNFHV